LSTFETKMKNYSFVTNVSIVNDTQLSLYRDINSKRMTVNKWDKEIEVEKSSYYWNGDPVTFKGTIHKSSRKPLVVELFCGFRL
jgi:hypothetical protein